MTPLDLYSRRSWIWHTAALVAACCSSGCTPLLFRGQSLDADSNAGAEEKSVRLVGDLAGATNMTFLKIEGVGLVTGLANTGSDPPPGGLRQRLVAEMQTHDVKDPNTVLASPTTSMVLVVGYLPPGVQKGDPLDVAITLPSGSETTSLRGGWLMQCRLRQTEVLGGAVTTGHITGLAGGNVLVGAVFDPGNDPLLLKRGRVLGGGVSQISRPLGLRVRGEGQSVMTTSLIGTAVNSRFHTFERGIKKGVATPKDDRYIELLVHPRYKHNVGRYVKVVGAIPLRESPAERAERLESLARLLADPTTAALAAVRLEAVGQDGVKILKQALAANDVEVRFYAAEALAYLDESDATDVLTETARREPALRWHALTALAAMDHIGAYESLAELLHEKSAETRYGAFRAMRARNPNDPLVKGEAMGDQFAYHVLSTTGEPMLHFSRHRRNEVVLFGHDLRMTPPAALFAGKEIIVKGLGADRIKVSRFSPGKDDRHIECSTLVDDVIRAIVKLEGTYPDVMQAVQDAKRANYVQARIVIDAVPQPDREFARKTEPDEENDEESHVRAAHPLPELFQNPQGQDREGSRSPNSADAADDDSDQQKKGFLGRMKDWFRD
jgi:hypothetical protein